MNVSPTTQPQIKLNTAVFCRCVSNTVRLSLKPDKLRVVARVSSARMQLKEFSLISHTIEPGTVLKALETAISWTAIEQAIGKVKAGEERKRALPSHLVVCLIVAMSLWSSASMRTVLKNLVDGLSEAWVRGGKYWRVPCKSSITEARQRVGSQVMTQLFHQVVRPLATVETPGAF